MIQKVTKILTNWLFKNGGQYNAAITRIFIAFALILILKDPTFDFLLAYNHWLDINAGLGWVPKGIIKLFDLLFQGIPPEWFVQAMYAIAWISVVCMLVGFLVPISQIIAIISILFIVSLETSFGPYWSHAFNVSLLAGLAFMFARSTDVLSVDALIRKMQNKSEITYRGNVYWWPVIFAELAVALFMFAAFYRKFIPNGFDWATSDNIRNSLMITWMQYRSDPPFIANFILQHPFLWKLAGLAQLFSQATTILAAFFINRPLFRLIFGGVLFFIEILALGYLFHFWHVFWIPLCFISVDWEYFYKRLISLRPTYEQKILQFFQMFRFSKSNKIINSTMVAPAFLSIRYRCFVGIFAIAFFGYYTTCFVFSLGEKHLNYPFSTFGFFSENRALKPYNIHQYFPIYTGRVDIFTEDNPHEPLSLGKRTRYRTPYDDILFRTSTINEFETINTSMQTALKAGIIIPTEEDPSTYEKVMCKKIIYRSGLMATTPYPMAPDFVDLHMGYRAVHDEKGFRAILGKLDWDENKNQYVISIEHRGFKKPQFEILARYNVRESPSISEPKKLPGYWENGRFFVNNNVDLGDFRFIYSLIKVEDKKLKIEEIYYGPDNFQSHR